MEKIYMEDSQQSRKSRSPFRLSVVLSFVVAFFAIFSLIACGVSQVSYAAPTDGEIVDDNFNFYVDEYKASVESYSTINGTSVLARAYSVPLYYADSNTGRSIFCIEPHASVSQVAYTRQKSNGVSTKINDPGLLYLLSNFYSNDGSNRNLAVDPRVSAFIKQAAIWIYITKTDKHNYTDVLTADPSDIEKDGTVLLSLYDGDLTGAKIGFISRSSNSSEYLTTEQVNIVSEKIRNLVNDALAQTGATDIGLAKEGEITQNDQGNYQITYKITSNAGDLIDYEVSVTDESGQPFSSENVWVVDEEGNRITDDTEVCNENSCIDKITIVVNKDIITEVGKNYVFNVGVNAEFAGLDGGIYEALENPGSYQKVVSVYAANTSDYASDEFAIIIDNTGMTTAQTIYFIGLVVLLCGIGIVYANAKPAESKQ